ncbi:hypothetical protein AM501_09495 [Aneurinibacillus migulanus]|uniref:leucine-rich repeat domain-containing protein n=1 Tax=Aneurinibacillus migulanus TaxID=47500 RepID=UPI0005B8F4AA|nr:leucine-rich repeat domain-containing protein [Aneurinibacillus migulanus]KIV58964.1 hypothetical protein TS64_04165 [Aneurinibacillus migulanus]KPD08514.1 hypothetical protein AM501_09495 [Aneurinibacillus migulanus]
MKKPSKHLLLITAATVTLTTVPTMYSEVYVTPAVAANKVTSPYVTIPDKGLEQQIRSTIKKPKGKLTRADMAKLTVLSASGDTVQVKNLAGLEHAENLKELHVDLNTIPSLKPLSGLKKLQKITLVGRNTFTDLTPISNLTNLQMVQIATTSLPDLRPLTKLPNLRELLLETEKPIKDITPLLKLSKLETFLVHYDEGVIDLSNPKNKEVLDVLKKRGVFVSSVWG